METDGVGCSPLYYPGSQGQTLRHRVMETTEAAGTSPTSAPLPEAPGTLGEQGRQGSATA